MANNTGIPRPAVLRLLLTLTVTCTVSIAGQGLYPSRATILGASSVDEQVLKQFQNSRAWRTAYRVAPRTACSAAIGGPRGNATANLCATSAAGEHSQQFLTELLMATSPAVYSTFSTFADDLHRSLWRNDGDLDEPEVGDQGPCDTCVAFAVSAAATLAAASSGIGDRDSISPQSLYFCSTIMRDCTAGWTLPDALLQLQAAFPRVATSSCLPYRPDPTGQLGPGQLCTLDKKCFNRDWVYGNKGDTLSFKQITSIPAAQLHIRQHGGVISRFDVYTDFRSFFSNSSNAKQIYAPSAGTQLVFEHAVVLVGYDNEKQFWLAQNSWGLHWGDQGHFRVAFGKCSVLAPGTGEAYGIVYTRQQPVRFVEQANIPGCYWYQATAMDYPSKIAFRFGIPLDQFMRQNTAYIKDLETSLTGVQVLCCNPANGTYLALTTNNTAEILKNWG